jgi:protease I
MSLKGKKIAAVATDGYHNTELTDPMNALIKAGAEVTVIGVSPEQKSDGLLDHETLKCPEKLSPAKRIKAARLIDEVSADQFDALLIPGGYSPERLRPYAKVISFVSDMYAAGKPIAAICHGPQLLISADVVRGRNMTCVSTIAVDLKNAGAIYLDKPLVVDANFITSRTPKDMDQFIKGFISALEK